MLDRLALYIKIQALGVAAAIVFGIAHDLVTAHVAVEYFTVHHPRLIHQTSPVAMALLWGVLATVVVGVAAGFWVGLANTVGPQPPLPFSRIFRMMAVMVAALLASSMAVLAVSYLFSLSLRSWTEPPDLARRLGAVGVTHIWSYAAAFITMTAAGVWVSRTRAREAASPASPGP